MVAEKGHDCPFIMPDCMTLWFVLAVYSSLYVVMPVYKLFVYDKSLMLRTKANLFKSKIISQQKSYPMFFPAKLLKCQRLNNIQLFLSAN